MQKEIIALMVNEQWSPEQIRGWMLCKGAGWIFKNGKLPT